MRTTLDLPDDVAAALRKESARRGGRGRAPMSALIAELVRGKYAPPPSPKIARVGGRPGCAEVIFPKGAGKMSMSKINRALDEMP